MRKNCQCFIGKVGVNFKIIQKSEFWTTHMVIFSTENDTEYIPENITEKFYK